MSEEDSQNLKEIKELFQSIDKKTTAYMDAKLKLAEKEIIYSAAQSKFLNVLASYVSLRER